GPKQKGPAEDKRIEAYRLIQYVQIGNEFSSSFEFHRRFFFHRAVLAQPFCSRIRPFMASTMIGAWMREFSMNHLWVSIPPQITPAKKSPFTLVSMVSGS